MCHMDFIFVPKYKLRFQTFHINYEGKHLKEIVLKKFSYKIGSYMQNYNNRKLTFLDL